MTSHPTRQVCIRVPKASPRTADRVLYEALAVDPAHRRQLWLEHILKSNGVYVGRPKCDGGWYVVPAVKAGSMFANPFSLNKYSLDESLNKFASYLDARCSDSASIEGLIELFSASQHHLLRKRYLGPNPRDEARSVRHYELGIYGAAFRERLRSLRGKRLGCWCEKSDCCHAGILAKAVNRMCNPVASAGFPPRREVELHASESDGGSNAIPTTGAVRPRSPDNAGADDRVKKRSRPRTSRKGEHREE